MPRAIWINCILFFWCSVIAGEFFDMYHAIPWWDLFLHVWSGFAITYFLVSRYGILAIAVTCTVLVYWETFEYFMDCVFDMNMQKSGLDDTMEDLIVGKLGAIVGYYYHRFRNSTG